MSMLTAVLQEVEKVSVEELKKYCDELSPKMVELTEKIQLLSWALQHNFIDTYVNFTVTKSLEQLNYKNRKNNILNDYTSLEDDIKTLTAKGINDQNLTELYIKMKKSYDNFKDLCTVVEGKTVLEKANHDYNRFNCDTAILSIKELKNELEKINFQGNLFKAMSKMTAQAENQLAIYAAHLSTEWESIFSWYEKKGLNFLIYSLSVQQSDPILIQKILKSLYLTELINRELALFSHFFIDQLLHNVIRHNCDIYTDEDIGALVFNIKIDLNDTKKPNFQTIFNNLMAIFEFLQSTLGSQFDKFESNRKFIEVFSDCIREKFFDKIIEDCLRLNLPSSESTYENYKNIVCELDSFNKFLIELKFVEAGASPLNKYIDDTECVLYNKKCDKLLSDVRGLLSQSLSYGTIVVGTSAVNENESVLDVTDKDVVWDLNMPIFLPKCVISENVKRIMSMIVEYLEESVKLPEKYSKKLVVYIKYVAVMYQAIVPKKFKINLECCPLDIALFFNNCFYLAHGLMGPPWCNILRHELADQLTVVLLECIQDLRVLGLEKVSLYLQNQKNIILQNIEAKDTSAWTYDTYEQFDSAINTALMLLKDLKMSWYDILPTKMYEMSMCTLIQALCQSMVDRVFANTESITEELVYMLALRFEDSVLEIQTLFEDPLDFDAKINIWTKFTKLPQLLKAQLLELSNLWNQKKEQLLCYTCEEVRQVVKMRFPDDKYRLKILKEIQ